ncbi:uncharacterized protein TM35_000651070 [Trypanosoma theileri]|uniref:Uncharacterized protein n=1 Tax=Trypanosoma theileri TaxID=67003 RepID=A0A1X0NFQ2_9TRYP|nr:uncharacterized protein TM35_000651070 [Trypanosoma theileri]ORC83545.1 hypothetical protein TM35_000651070 [Trypanosoma theileri]
MHSLNILQEVVSLKTKFFLFFFAINAFLAMAFPWGCLAIESWSQGPLLRILRGKPWSENSFSIAFPGSQAKNVIQHLGRQNRGGRKLYPRKSWGAGRRAISSSFFYIIHLSVNAAKKGEARPQRW